MDEGKRKVKLTMSVDHHAIDSLDRVAAAGGDETTARVMCRFFEGLRDSVEVLECHQHGGLAVIRDELARILLSQLPGASPQALLFAGSIWARAAELTAQEGAHK